MKEEEVNTLKNPWMKMTMILLIIFIGAMLIQGYRDYKESTNKEIELNKTIESGKFFLDFAMENHLGEVCNIEQRVCCNTITGVCVKV